MRINPGDLVTFIIDGQSNTQLCVIFSLPSLRRDVVAKTINLGHGNSLMIISSLNSDLSDAKWRWFFIQVMCVGSGGSPGNDGSFGWVGYSDTSFEAIS
jgi:hypothetical protein